MTSRRAAVFRILPPGPGAGGIFRTAMKVPSYAGPWRGNRAPQPRRLEATDRAEMTLTYRASGRGHRRIAGRQEGSCGRARSWSILRKDILDPFSVPRRALCHDQSGAPSSPWHGADSRRVSSDRYGPDGLDRAALVHAGISRRRDPIESRPTGSAPRECRPPGTRGIPRTAPRCRSRSRPCSSWDPARSRSLRAGCSSG